jgi:hypothetical protein
MSERWAADVAMAQGASGGSARQPGGYLYENPKQNQEQYGPSAAEIVAKQQSGDWGGDAGAVGVSAVNAGYADNLAKQAGIQTMYQARLQGAVPNSAVGWAATPNWPTPSQSTMPWETLAATFQNQPRRGLDIYKDMPIYPIG